MRKRRPNWAARIFGLAAVALVAGGYFWLRGCRCLFYNQRFSHASTWSLYRNSAFSNIDTCRNDRNAHDAFH